MGSAVNTSKFVLSSDRGTELYLTLTDPAGADAEAQVVELFSEAGAALREGGAHAFQERVFVGAEAAGAVASARARGYGAAADELPPTVLLNPAGAPAALQVHAVGGPDRPELLRWDGRPAGRVLRTGGRTYAALSGLVDPTAGDAARQAGRVYEAAEAVLARAGADLRSVVRTWVWLGDILDWYDAFNAVRNGFFRRRGLTGAGAERAPHLPASTGIGVRPLPAPGRDGRPACALDVLAVVGEDGAAEFLPAAGRQQSPWAYGSAFSRAAVAETPGGRTVWVSGTAAIDADGASCRVGDPHGQIEMTLANVRAVLAAAGCRDADVVQAVAYCKTPDVLALWRADDAGADWPCASVLSDVCRPELLFEVEATACVAGGP